MNNNMRVRAYRNCEEALSEIEREMNVRSRCFPGWVEQGKMNRIDAQDRLDRLASAYEIVREVADRREWLEHCNRMLKSMNIVDSKAEGGAE